MGWHCECFFCQDCNTSLLGSNFVAIGSGDDVKIYCQPCGFQRKGWSYDDVLTGQRIEPKKGEDSNEQNESKEESKRKKKGLLDKLEEKWDDVTGGDKDSKGKEKEKEAEARKSESSTPSRRRQRREQAK